jgi:hypothetical protein
MASGGLRAAYLSASTDGLIVEKQRIFHRLDEIREIRFDRVSVSSETLLLFKAHGFRDWQVKNKY